MKILLKYFSFLVIGVLTVGPASADILQKEILGIEWGTDISTLKSFQKLWNKDSVSFYLNPGVHHTIYGIQVPSVVYGFYTGKFFAAYVKIDDPTVFNRLKDELTAQYGDPKITEAVENEQRIFSWKKGYIKIKLKLYERNDQVKLAFYYMPLSETVNEIQQEELQEKTWTLFPIDKAKPKNMSPIDLPSIPIFRF